GFAAEVALREPDTGTVWRGPVLRGRPERCAVAVVLLAEQVLVHVEHHPQTVGPRQVHYVSNARDDVLVVDGAARRRRPGRDGGPRETQPDRVEPEAGEEGQIVVADDTREEAVVG